MLFDSLKKRVSPRKIRMLCFVVINSFFLSFFFLSFFNLLCVWISKSPGSRLFCSGAVSVPLLSFGGRPASLVELLSLDVNCIAQKYIHPSVILRPVLLVLLVFFSVVRYGYRLTPSYSAFLLPLFFLNFPLGWIKYIVIVPLFFLFFL